MTAGDRRQPAFWLSVGFFLVPPVGLFAALAATPIFLFCVVLALWCGRAARPVLALPRAVALVLGGGLVWTLVSSVWAPSPSPRAALAVAGLAVVGLLCTGLVRRLPAAQRDVAARWAVLGCALAAAALLAEVVANYPLTRLIVLLKTGESPLLSMDSVMSRGVAVLLTLLWPASVAAYRWKGAAAALALGLVAAAGIALNGKHATLLALAVGALGFVATLVIPRLSIAACRLGTVALVAAMPLIGLVLPPVESLAQSGLFSSARHRVVIWTFALDRIGEHPWRGWGMDASRNLPGGDEETVVEIIDPSANLWRFPYQHMPLHPHNGPLQVWLELGAVGAVLMAALLWTVWGQVPRPPRSRLDHAAATAAILTIVVVGSLSYGLWQSWWQAAMWLTALLCSTVGFREGETPAPRP